MARFSAEHFEEAVDFLEERGIDFDPQDFAMEIGDLSRDDQAELWDIIQSGDYEAFQDFCEEHDIHYHG